MATVTKVDDLSAEDRRVVVGALALSLASSERAARGAKSDGLKKAHEADAAVLSALIARFR